MVISVLNSRTPILNLLSSVKYTPHDGDIT